MKKLKFNSLTDMLNSDKYQMFESDTLLNIQYHIINTDKNIDNMIEANNSGLFGCTHQEFIDTWRDFVNTFEISKVFKGIILAQIDECEQYHLNKGTINNEI